MHATALSTVAGTSVILPVKAHTVSNAVTIQTQYDSVYLTCSKKLTGSQLSLPHGINKKLKCENLK